MKRNYSRHGAYRQSSVGFVAGLVLTGAVFGEYFYGKFKADIDPNYLRPDSLKVKTMRAPDSDYKETDLILHFDGDVSTIPLTNENVEKIIKAIQ